MSELFIFALLAGCILALIAGPVGSFVLWRRMAFFGDTLTHSVFLGVAISLFFSIDIRWGIAFIGIVIASLLSWRKASSMLSFDTLLSVVSHGGFALGLLAVFAIAPHSLNLFHVFFGDILATGMHDILWVSGGGILSLSVLLFIWRPLLNSTINEDLAAIDGDRIFLSKWLFMVIVAVFVALALKIVGALLTTALLITPAATVRPWVKSPQKMALFSSLLGSIGVALGITLSFMTDMPTSPMIVVSLLAFFLVGQGLSRAFNP